MRWGFAWFVTWVLGWSGMVQAMAPPTVCLLHRDDLARLRDADSKQQVALADGMVKLVGCRGQLPPSDALATSIWVWYLDAEDSRTRRLRLEGGQTLAALFANVRTSDIAPEGSLLARLWAVASQAAPGQRSFSRFDPRDGIPMGGSVLPGRALIIPLALFGWDPKEPAQLIRAGQPALTLTPVNGELTLELRRHGPGSLSLVQKTLRAELHIVSEADAREVLAGLQAIEQDGAPASARRWRKVVWLSENGYELDAIQEQLSR